jgi:hypothetical protein
MPADLAIAGGPALLSAGFSATLVAHTTAMRPTPRLYRTPS